MKAMVEYLHTRGLIFKSFREITPKELGSRKQVTLYLGVDLKGYYALVMEISKKSRILRKEADELMRLHTTLEQYIQSRITKQYLRVNAPLCSHAKTKLEEAGWRVWHKVPKE